LPEGPLAEERLTRASSHSLELGPAAGVFLPLTACALLLAWALGGVALVFAALMVSALACSWLLGRRNVRGLALCSTRAELRTVGEEFLLELEVERAALKGPAHDLVLALEGPGARPAGLVSVLPAADSVRTPLALKLTERGPVRQLELRVESSYPFGLLRHVAHFRLPVDLLGLPRLGSLGDLAKLGAGGSEASRHRQLQRSEEDEFRSIVEWRPGQSLRSAHWKLSARRGRPLLVEREEHSALPVTIALLTHSAPQPRGGSDSFETAVSLSATLCEHYLRRGRSVRLLISGSEQGPATRLWGREGLASCLVRLAHARPGSAPGRDAFDARLAQPRQRHESLILVHAGGRRPLPLEAAREAALVLDVDAPGLDALFVSGRSFGTSPALTWSDAV
jgi:uncharacterized protein (DUF58 family)